MQSRTLEKLFRTETSSTERRNPVRFVKVEVLLDVACPEGSYAARRGPLHGDSASTLRVGPHSPRALPGRGTNHDQAPEGGAVAVLHLGAEKC